VRTFVEIVARATSGGGTALSTMRASGQLAVRRTGPATVHLVATAFGPLGGDDADIRLTVAEGATLRLRSVAAAVALPSRGEPVPSLQRITAIVDGSLEIAPEPTVVAAGAQHRAVLTAELGPSGALHATEQVLLGRSGETPGRWTGSVRVTQEGTPLLHTTVGLGPGEAAWLPPVAPRAYASTVHIGADEAGVLTRDDGVRVPLPGGWVATAWGAELHRVVANVHALTPDAALRGIA
jgi:urease accessory protein